MTTRRCETANRPLFTTLGLSIKVAYSGAVYEAKIRGCRGWSGSAKTQVSEGIEPSSRESESHVLTITLWNRCCQLRSAVLHGGQTVLFQTIQLAVILSSFFTPQPSGTTIREALDVLDLIVYGRLFLPITEAPTTVTLGPLINSRRFVPRAHEAACPCRQPSNTRQPQRISESMKALRFDKRHTL